MSEQTPRPLCIDSLNDPTIETPKQVTADIRQKAESVSVRGDISLYKIIVCFEIKSQK